MKIRKATHSDFKDIQRLNKMLFEFEEQFKHEYNLNWPYEEAGVNYFRKRFENNNAIIYVVEEENHIIGYIIGFIDTYPYRNENPICEIENMFVEEKYRYQGIGKALMEKVRKEAKSRDVKRLRVGAIAQNEHAINFYKSQGFSDVNLYLEVKL